MYQKAGGNVDSAVQLFHQKLERNPSIYKLELWRAWRDAKIEAAS
jgi:hypothetical protein